MFYRKWGKSLFDFTLFILLSPLVALPFLLIVLLLSIFQGRPIFYKAKRAGFKNKDFYIYKFRTMYLNQEKGGGDTTALNDPRITPLGSLLRKFKLDEIPQMINVLKGEMSFVGPRPELLFYTNQYNDLEKQILSVKPGITDNHSINFSALDKAAGEDDPDTVFETYILPLKNKSRLEYSENISFIGDIRIIVKTFFVLIKKVFNLEKIPKLDKYSEN